MAEVIDLTEQRRLYRIDRWARFLIEELDLAHRQGDAEWQRECVAALRHVMSDLDGAAA
jgi:hypothetical protein